MFKTNNKKAFTLIELIVVMAVIGILVLLAMPKFMGYTEKARLTELKSNIRQLENASERYYIDHDDWPRLSDTPYTAEQIEGFTQQVKDKTGQVITLDSAGKYYDIDYNKLQKYVQKPKNDVNYIIQNPVGEVYYLDGLTEKGSSRLTADPNITYVKDVAKTTTGYLNKDATNGREAMYDKNFSTSYAFSSSFNNGYLTWTGDMANRMIRLTLNINGGWPPAFVFYDKDNNPIKGMINNNINSSFSFYDSQVLNIIIPPNAVKLGIVGDGSFYCYIYEIEEFDDKELPNSPSAVSSVPDENKVILSWVNPTDNDFSKVLVYRGETYLGNSTNGTFVDTSLYEDYDYTYTLYAQDITGNISNPVIINAHTVKTGVVFRGLPSKAFDKDINTYTDEISSYNHGYVTWDDDISGKIMKLTLSVYSSWDASLVFYDKDNKLLNFQVNNGQMKSSYQYFGGKTTLNILVPQGAVKFGITGSSEFRSMIYELECE